jgi:dihydropteroate synthase
MATRLDTRITSALGPASGADVFAALLAKARPLVMGVLNVTPDSFSDGGRFLDPQAAIAQARRLVGEGADLLDIGAESTRPYGGAVSVPLDEELARLAPVLPGVSTLGVPVSIDTLKARVAAWALDQGAAIVNDVWGLQRDPARRSSSCIIASAPTRRSTSSPT